MQGASMVAAVRMPSDPMQERPDGSGALAGAINAVAPVGAAGADGRRPPEPPLHGKPSDGVVDYGPVPMVGIAPVVDGYRRYVTEHAGDA